MREAIPMSPWPQASRLASAAGLVLGVLASTALALGQERAQGQEGAPAPEGAPGQGGPKQGKVLGLDPEPAEKKAPDARGAQDGPSKEGTSGATAAQTSGGRGGAAHRLSAFERQLEAYVDPLVKTPIRQFGYEIFERPQEVSADGPVGPDYVLGPGDRIVVSIWGNMLDEDYRASIDPDGQARLPQVGLVNLRGLTLEAAEKALKQKFDQILKNYNLELRLGRLRDMQVHVVGAVASPGRVRVSSVATLFDALAAAGGITKEGTLRRIALRRQGQPPRAIDLFNYLLDGDLSVDVSLKPGDAVVVPPIGARAAVVGRVLRPAIYELAGEEISFDGLLAMAGGYARLADRSTLQVESASSKGLSIRTVDLTATRPADLRLKDGDVCLVRAASPRLENVVYVAGDVSMPGRYAYRAGMRVADVLDEQTLVEAGFWLKRSEPGPADPGAPLPEPFLEYALVRRIELPGHEERRLAFHLGKALFEKDPKENLLLQPQDTIVVFPRSAFETPDAVYVSGAVQKPGEQRFTRGMRVKDLVRSAGGLRPEAQLAGAMLTRVHPDQSGARFETLVIDLEKAMAGDEAADISLQPGDGLAVKLVPEYRAAYRVEVSGEVRHPGTYTVVPGERLSDLLKRAGGFTKDAYVPASQFHRESVRRLQQERIDESLERLELELKTSAQRFSAEAAATGNQRADAAAEQARVEKLISTIRATPAKGRLVIRLDAPEALAGTEEDIELSDGDKLVVPRRPQEVTVIGAVFNQTSVLYASGRTARDYLADCGGPSGLADMSLAYVIRADGSADSAQSARKGYRWEAHRARYSRGDLLGSEMHPGDTLVVPYDVKPQLSSLALTKTVTELLFQTALATGVIVALL